MDEVTWQELPARGYVPVPELEGSRSHLKAVGVRALTLLQQVGLYEALDVLRDPEQGFIDLEGTGLHVIGFTRQGIVFLDSSGQMKPGMDVGNLLDLGGNRLLPPFIDAADGTNDGQIASGAAWPHPVTQKVGALSAWCGMLTAQDVVCVLAWDQGERGGE